MHYPLIVVRPSPSQGASLTVDAPTAGRRRRFDWIHLGGRYTGFFTPRPDADPADLIDPWPSVVDRSISGWAGGRLRALLPQFAGSTPTENFSMEDRHGASFLFGRYQDRIIRAAALLTHTGDWLGTGLRLHTEPDDPSAADFHATATTYLDSLPDEMVLAVFDCRIDH